ncbi:MAG: hypothetical protein ABIK53_00185 [bacterium]
MNTKNEIKQPPLAPQKKECRECGQEISIKAKKCYHCGSHQAKWKNLLLYIPYVISIGMMVIAVVQVNEAKKERSDASQALREIDGMKNIITSVVRGVRESEKNISKLEKDMQRKTEQVEKRVTALQKAIDEAALQTSKALPAREESKLEYSTHSVQKTSEGIQTIISFKSSTNLPLGRVEFSIEIEGKTDAKILSINPAEGVSFAVISRIERDGKKGHLSYVSAGSSSPKIEIKLSAPTKLTIQGKPELDSFGLDIK